MGIAVFTGQSGWNMEQIKRFFENMDEIVYIADMDNYEIIVSVQNPR